jgi:hypothetical protein
MAELKKGLLYFGITMVMITILTLHMDISIYWSFIYFTLLVELQLSMKTFIQTLAILITAAFIFGCPPKHEEPASGSLVATSRSEHLFMGNPSGAIDSVSYSNNYLMEKPQYVVSYNRDRGVPNWVARQNSAKGFFPAGQHIASRLVPCEEIELQ